MAVHDRRRRGRDAAGSVPLTMMFRLFEVKPAVWATLDVVAVGLDRRERRRRAARWLRRGQRPASRRTVSVAELAGWPWSAARIGAEAGVAFARDARLDDLDVGLGDQDRLGLGCLLEDCLASWRRRAARA